MMTPPILPPSMLGILGGGQLGRMFTVAAKTMGYGVTVLDPDAQAPAAAFADVHLHAAFDDSDALVELARCAAVTTEFENVNADSMRWLAQQTRVSPAGDCVAIAQNRILEKARIRAAGLNTAPYHVIESAADVPLDNFFPAILKTATLGYDGKGQIVVHARDDFQAAFEKLKSVPCVLEQRIDLKAEISVIVCRLSHTHCRTYTVSENQHENGILAYSIVPARLPESLLRTAQDMAVALANELDYVGVLAVEMFVTRDDELLVNEMAPRPHNSGHYTLDACASDQFQQQVRLMCGLPPAATDLLSSVCMANILGDVWPDNGQPHWDDLLQAPKAFLHSYGKKVARPGRKMAHFNVLAASADAALQEAQFLHRTLSQETP